MTGLAYWNKIKSPSPKLVMTFSTGIYCKADTILK
jgi:hypothetical protein